MTCENVFCIYQKNNKCLLEEISLDIDGICTNCIYIDIAQKNLKELKEKQLQNFENSYLEEKRRA